MHDLAKLMEAVELREDAWSDTCSAVIGPLEIPKRRVTLYQSFLHDSQLKPCNKISKPFPRAGPDAFFFMFCWTPDTRHLPVANSF